MVDSFRGLSERLSGRSKEVQQGYSKTLKALSSGLRVADAFDDAAALSLSEQASSRSAVFTKGVQNISDSISLVQIASDGLEAMNTIAQRLNELVNQSKSDNLNSSQRESIQSESDALVSEYNRILATTESNQSAILAEKVSFRTQAGFGGDGGFELNLKGIGNNAVSYVGEGDQAIVSRTSSGVAYDDISTMPDISGDGRFVVYDSYASNAVAGDTNGTWDVFLHDRRLGTTELVSKATDGTQGNNRSGNPKISEDGRYVVFSSTSTNLVAGDTNGQRDIFIRDQLLGTTTRITDGNGTSDHADISADGQKITFSSDASNLVSGDTNGRRDVFMYDVGSAVLSRISLSSAGVEGNLTSEQATISGDGRYVVFTSDATNLVASDTNAAADVFRRDTVTGVTELVSASASGTIGNLGSATDNYYLLGVLQSVSENGNYITFMSDATNLVSAADTNGVTDIFRKNMDTGEIIRLGASLTGAEGNGLSVNASISGDGRYILFTSDASNLVSGDTNGASDYFLYDSDDQSVKRISVNSDGAESDDNLASPFDQYGGIISRDGRSIVFQSDATNLVAGDSNARKDIFLYSIEESGNQGGFSRIPPLYLLTSYGAETAQIFMNEINEELTLGFGAISAAKSRLDTALSNTQSAVSLLDMSVEKITAIDVASSLADLVKLKVQANVNSAMAAHSKLNYQKVSGLLVDFS